MSSCRLPARERDCPDSWRENFVLEGEMEFEIAGQVCHPAIGEELLIPARAIHSAQNIGTTTARWLFGYNR
jgi:Cupin domain